MVFRAEHAAALQGTAAADLWGVTVRNRVPNKLLHRSVYEEGRPFLRHHAELAIVRQAAWGV